MAGIKEYYLFLVIQAKQLGVEVAVQLGEGMISEEQLSDPLTMRESECSLVCPEHILTVYMYMHTLVIVIHAYDVSLRASKEREHELQSQVDALQHQSIVKEQKLSKLEENASEMQKRVLILKNDNEKQQEVLEKLQQKGKQWSTDLCGTCTNCSLCVHTAVKAKLSVEVAVQVDELFGYEQQSFIQQGSSTTGGKYSKACLINNTL